MKSSKMKPPSTDHHIFNEFFQGKVHLVSVELRISPIGTLDCREKYSKIHSDTAGWHQFSCKTQKKNAASMKT
jgi:hypothetical protein